MSEDAVLYGNLFSACRRSTRPRLFAPLTCWRNSGWHWVNRTIR